MEKQKLPNATAVLVLGILSIVGCCCYGVIGLILGIVALIIAKKDLQAYRLNPELYSNYSNLNTGRILAIIGIVFSAVVVAIYIFLIATYGVAGMMEMNQEMMRDWQSR